MVQCLYQPQTIAAAVVYLAARQLNVELVTSPHPWYTLFDAKLEDLELVSLLILDLYQVKKIMNIIPSKLLPDMSNNI